MKRINSFLVLFFVSICLFSCEKEENSFEFNETPISHIDEKDKSAILKLGFDTVGITVFDDYYVVEEDVLLHKERLDEHDFIENSLQPTLRQAYHSKIATTKVQGITVGFDTAFPSTGNLSEWREALHSALAYWNSIPDCAVSFFLSTALNPDIYIYVINDNNTGLVARAEFPTNGKPGSFVQINSNLRITLNLSQKTYNMVHELGHCLGLRHTNWSQLGESPGNHISGTPQTDPNSVMNGATGTHSWTGFSQYDIRAIQQMYPSFLQPNPKFIRTDVGYYNTLYPNIMYYNDAIAYWEGTGEILEYEWASVGWNIILHPQSQLDQTMKFAQFNPVSPQNPSFVRIRARNQYGWGEWSDPRLVNVDFRSN